MFRSLPSALRQPWATGGALYLLALLVYLPALGAGFVWDDLGTVLENPFVHSPSGLFSIWFTDRLTDYWPLTYTLFWAEWQLWGDNPFGYHLVNLLLHASASVVLWRILKRLAIPGAWLIAAAFAIHPVTAASAAWISEGKNTLSMLLALISVSWWLRFDAGEDHRWRTRSLIAFVLALLAKTSMVGIPIVLLALAWWRRSRISRNDIKGVAPFLAASLVLGLVTIFFQSGNAIQNEEIPVRDFGERISGTGWAFAFYWLKDLLPVDLAIIYPNWKINGANLLHWLPLAGLLGIAAAAWRSRKTWGRPLLLTGIASAALLLPVLGLIEMAFQRFSLVADHLQYTAIVFPLAVVIGGISRWLHTKSVPTSLKIGLSCVLLMSLAILTWNQAKAYHSNTTFWAHVDKHNSGAWVAHYHLGKIATEAGNAEVGIALFEKALALNERHARSHNNLGAVLLGRGETERAEHHLQRALELRPDLAVAQHNFGLILAGRNEIDAAAAAFEEAVSLRPDYVDAFDNLGVARMLQGRHEEAIATHWHAIELDPTFAKAFLGLGDAYSRLGQLDQSIAAFNQFLQLQPNDAGARYRIGKTLRSGGCHDEAIPHLAAAIKVFPGVADGHLELARALADSGDKRGAIDELQVALQLDPKLAAAQTLLTTLQTGLEIRLD